MKSLIRFFIKYPAWPNVIKVLVLIFGLMALFNLKSSFFPEIENRTIFINIAYPGASPEEIEKGVIQKIEDNLKGVLGIERYTSKSMENTGTVTVEVQKGYDVDEVLSDVKNAVEMINSFPIAMEPPTIYKQPTVDPAVSFTVWGNVDLKTLKITGDKIEDDLRSIDGISQVEVTGYPNQEIDIDLKEEVLRAYGLTFDQVAAAVRNENIDLTGGSIKTRDEEILIRLEAKEYYADFLQDIVVKSDPSGKIVRLSDIADVKDAWEEDPRQTFVNGQKSIIVTVNKILGEDIIDVVKKVKTYINKFNKENKVLSASIVDDRTIPLTGRLNMLLTNGLQGAFLILLSLALFLNLRLSFWVALGLPFSFLGMFLMMYIAGITLNVISLFGCIVVVGILVDDGIVISEQIFQYHEAGMKPFSAALEGVMNVLPSVVFAVLTTIAAFLPFFFFEGRNGEFMRDMAFVVILAITFSLLESSLILPSHLAHSKALRKKDSYKFREKLNRIVLYPRDHIYAKTLKYFLRRKIVVVAIGIAITMITIGAIAGGVIKATFFPYIDFDSFEITLQMPAGTREDITAGILNRISKAAWEVNEEIKKQRPDQRSIIKNVVVNIAQGASGMYGVKSTGGANVGTVKIVMIDGEIRNMESFKVANMIRKKTGPVYGAERLTFGDGSRFGKPVSVPLISPSSEELVAAKNELKDSLKAMSELKDITDDDPEGLREIKLKLKPQAYLLGLNNMEVARQVRQGFFGAEVQRLQRGIDEIKVWAKYPPGERSSIGYLENMRVKLPNGNDYPLTELVDYNIKRGILVINHLDGKRDITVEADVADQYAEVPPILNQVKNKILPAILARYPGVSTAESGQQREINKFQRSQRVPMMVAMIFMFSLVVLSFRSLLQAVVVFMLIPLGLIGAAWGHFIHDMPLNIMSTYGIIALIGIIVNNAIVFINTSNQYLQEGKKLKDAVYEAAINRFRPILLTTVTTVFGLYPLILNKSTQATFLVPMAISVAYGLLIGSVLILMFLPVFLVMLNELKRGFTWMLHKGKVVPAEDVEPAVIEMHNIKEFFSDEDLK